MIAQLDFLASMTAPKLNTEDQRALHQVVGLLDAMRGWMTASEILEAFGVVPNENLRRWLRRIVGHTDDIISGQKGYRHIDHATDEESDHAANWIDHQGQEMICKASRIRRRRMKKTEGNKGNEAKAHESDSGKN